MPVREAVIVDGGRTVTPNECSQFNVRAALRRLQRKFHLRPSGRLDDDTKQLMSRGRCGNTDTDVDGQPETVWRRTGNRGRRKRSADGDDQPEVVLEPPRTRRQQSEVAYAQRPWQAEIDSRKTGSRERRKRSAEDADVAHARRAMTSSLESRVSGGIDHADLHSRLVPGTDHEPGAALSRRTKMFVEIRRRHSRRLAAEAAQVGETSPRCSISNILSVFLSVSIFHWPKNPETFRCLLCVFSSLCLSSSLSLNFVEIDAFANNLLIQHTS